MIAMVLVMVMTGIMEITKMTHQASNERLTELHQRILNSISRNVSGRLHLAPRTGKTRLLIELIKRDDPRSILWVTPSSKLAKYDIKQEFEIWNAEVFIPKLKAITYNKLPEEQGKYDLIVLDEEQSLTSHRSKTLLNKSLTGRIISMTGTPTKSFDKESLFMSLNLRILYTLSVEDATEDILSDYEINIVHIPLSDSYPAQANCKGTEKVAYNYLTKRLERAQLSDPRSVKMLAISRRTMIAKSISKYRTALKLKNKLDSKRFVMFCPTIDTANILGGIQTYHSKTNDLSLREFLAKRQNHLFMVNTGGVGFTFTGIEHLIIMQVDADVNGNTTQKICRALINDGIKPVIWILQLDTTQDEVWVNQTLTRFSANKISHITWDELDGKLEDIKRS